MPALAAERVDLPTDEAEPATSIVVVASGRDELLSGTGQPVSVIGADEIAQVQGGDVVRVLERLPGTTATRNGGVGSFTGLRVRGAEAEQLLVLVDGVRVADVAAPAGGFDLGTLLPAGIAKIELLRGSNSTIWGSQAMGGVLAVETLGLAGVAGSVEYGGPDAAYAQASAGTDLGAVSAAVDAALYDADGISAAADGTERDGVRQWQVGGRLIARLAPDITARASLRHVDARVDIDGFPAPDFELADTAAFQDTRRTSATVGADYVGPAIELRATASLAETERANFDPAAGADPTYTTRGRDERVELRGRWAATGAVALRFGGEASRSRMETLFDAEQRSNSWAAYGQLGYRRAALALNAGLRIEDHDRFGSASTFGADGALDLGGGWRVRGSYGEGFKAPTLFQLLSDYGNPALRPERSRGFDVGIETGDRNAPLHASASVFRRDSTDLIGFVSCWGIADGICEGRPFGTYDNIGRARAEGFELEAAAAVASGVRLQGVYTYVESTNRAAGSADEGNDLARRPRHAATLSADWSTPWRVAVGADLRIVSGSFDDAANSVRLAGYQLLTVRAALPLTDAIELFGRVENLTDEDYTVAAGYGTQGRSAYLGARARW